MHLTFTRSSHFIPCAQTVSCPAVTSLLSLLLFCTPFLLHSFCTVPQGPPGPQGSPHPQPPPPNSMMGPHAQVTLRLSLSSSISLFFISIYFYFYSDGNIGSQCWCFMLWHSSQLSALSCFQRSHKFTFKFPYVHWAKSHGATMFFCHSHSCHLGLLEAPEAPP